MWDKIIVEKVKFIVYRVSPGFHSKCMYCGWVIACGVCKVYCLSCEPSSLLVVRDNVIVVRVKSIV